MMKCNLNLIEPNKKVVLMVMRLEISTFLIMLFFKNILK